MVNFSWKYTAILLLIVNVFVYSFILYDYHRVSEIAQTCIPFFEIARLN